MLLCFGSRRRARHHPVQWNEDEFLLDDEPQMIPNPCFLDTGKGQHRELLQLNTRCHFAGQHRGCLDYVHMCAYVVAVRQVKHLVFWNKT